MNLKSFVARKPEAGELLASDLPNAEVLRRLADMGYQTSEGSVRRYRANPKPYVAPSSDSSSKDMPAFTEYEGPNGRAALHLPRADYTEQDLLREAGFDPNCWRIKGHVNTRKWMRYDQEWLFYYKFDVEQGESVESKLAHVEELVATIRKRTPGTPWAGQDGGTYVFVMSDWQIGKCEGGSGSPQTVQRYRECLGQALNNIKALRKIGAKIDHLAILSVGDLVEGCGDHYSMQTFSIDLDRRSQNRVVRELITETILTLAPQFESTHVAVIGGNHGEHRKDGKAFTTFADNDDVAGPEAVAEAFRLADYPNLTWSIPDDELSMCVDVSGVKIGIVHGHQFKGGANAWKKAEDWWRSNVFGLEPVNDAQILLSGHFHHFVHVNVTAGRTWMQAPTIDPGSKWYSDRSGVTATPGVLTFVANASHPLGYDFLRVLVPTATEQAT